MTDKELVHEALIAREYAYAPYSEFMVGAALLCEDGTVYRGCNIENAAFSPTNCAERTAFFKAVSEGVKNFTKIAVVGGKKNVPIDSFAYPCGVCRQVMMEFCNPEMFEIIVAKSEGNFKSYKLKELLPNGFGPEDL